MVSHSPRNKSTQKSANARNGRTGTLNLRRGSRTDEQAALVAQQLAVCQAWQPTVPDQQLID